jgi:predicted metal-dependent phosphoesterase TrpH
MGLADLHIHTTYSRDGTASVESMVRYAAERTELQVIAITDHDEIQGAREAVELGGRYGIYVIPGSEISTTEGHLLALFLDACVPAGLSLVETVLRVGEQGGLCIAPHPTAPRVRSLSETSLRIALRDPDVRQILVGIEACNAGLIDPQSNGEALRLARRLRKAQVGSSDSHLPWTIGSAATAFAGATPAELRRALEIGATTVIRGRTPRRVQVIGGWLGGMVQRRRALAAGQAGSAEARQG